MTEIAILGTGTGGLGAAYRLRDEKGRRVLYDKNPFYGGHTHSFRHPGGFTFDRGPHVSFTKDERIQKLLADAIDGAFETVPYRVNNYWQGHWITHPVQCNLYGLPADLVVKILVAFVQETQRSPGPIANYEDWLVTSYGRPLAETFPMQYTRKYHTTDAANLTTDWMGPRMYRPSLEEVFFGAVSPTTPNIHYVTHFRYPTHGGFASYLERFSKNGDILLDHRLTRLDPKAKELTFANGTRARYDAVVSSIPLPELVPMIAGAPDDVREAAKKLACSTAVIVNVGVNRADLSQAHISYFYDSDVFFTRLNFPHMLSPNNVPPGAGAIQAEVYFSKKYKPLDRSPDDCMEPVIRDLYRVGVLREGDEILHRNAELIDYANIIFDQDRKQALGLVHGYLDDIGVHYCGRYGDWGYLWTDDSFKSGELAAERALSAKSR